MTAEAEEPKVEVPQPAPTPAIYRHAAKLLPAQALKSVLDAALPFLLATWFGKGGASDAFFLTQGLFLFVVSLLAGAFQDSAVVPVLSEVRSRKTPKEYDAVAGALVGWALVAGFAVGALFAAVAFGWFSWVRPLPAPFTGPRPVLMLLVPFALWAPLLALRASIGGILQARGALLATPLASALGTVLSAALLFGFHQRFGVVAIPSAQAAGEGVAALLAARYLLTTEGVPLRLSLARPEALRKLGRLVASEVLGAAVTRINPVVDQAFAATIAAVGAVSTMRYTNDLATVPTSVAQLALFPVLLVVLSRLAAEGDERTFSKVVHKAIVQVSAFTIVVGGVVWLVRRPLLRAVFFHGSMTELAVEDLIEVLPWALANAPPFALLLLLVRAHTALGNSRIMFPLGVFNAAVNLLGDSILVRFFGVRGILLSTATTHTAVVVVLYLLLQRTLRERRVPAQGHP